MPRDRREIVSFLRARDRGIGVGGIAPTGADAGDTDVEIVSPVFFDPEGARLRG